MNQNHLFGEFLNNNFSITPTSSADAILADKNNPRVKIEKIILIINNFHDNLFYNNFDSERIGAVFETEM